MAFSKTAIKKAEDDALATFGVECKYNQASSTWYKVVSGVVTPFDLRDPTDRNIRDWCRQALLQADYDEQQQQQNNPNPNPPPDPGKGFWETLLGDSDIRTAVHNAVPQQYKPFITPLMDTLQGALGSTGAGMSPGMAAVAGAGIAGAGGFAMGRAAGTSGVASGIGGAVGFAAGGPLGAILGAAIGTVLEKAFQDSAHNIREMRQLGVQSVGNLVNGASSLITHAYDVGFQLGDTLLRAALRPFGATGQALSNFGTQIGQSLKGVLQAGLGIAGSGLKAVGGLAAGAVGVGLAGGGLLLGLTGGLLGGAISMVLATLLGKVLMQVLSVVTGVIGGVLDQLGKAFGELGKVAGAALKGLLEILEDVKGAALGLSKSILDLSQNSGMSIGAASAATNNLAGFGITPQQTAQMFGQNILYTKAMDQGWGIGGDPGSAQNLREFRDVYQSLLKMGNGNPLIANSMATQTGKAALIPMANLPQDVFERSLANGQDLQMGDAAVKAWQQDFALLQSDLMRFVEFVKVTLGNAFLPAMQQGLGMAVTYFKAHKDDIIAGIKAIGRWFYADLPAAVLDGAIFIVRSFAIMTHALANMLRGFSDGKGVIHDFIHGFLAGIDRLVASLIHIGQVGAAAMAFMHGGPMAAGVAYVAAGAYLGQYQTHLADDFDKATARQFDANGKPIKTAADLLVDGLDDTSNKSWGLVERLMLLRKDVDPAARGKEYDKMFDTLQKIEQNTGRTPTMNANIQVQISPQEEFLAKILSYDQWMVWQNLGATAS